MSLFRNPGPIEPSAAERAQGTATVPERCAACHTTGHPTERLALAGHGHVSVCTNPKACRERAQAAGIWKETGHAH